MAAIGFFKFVVKDSEAMLAFYEKAFGFAQSDLIDLPDFSERVLRLPGGAVSLVLFHNKDGRDLEVGTAHGPLGIVTDKVDEFYHQAIDAGATSKLEPMDLGPVRLAFVLDPEGHEVELIDLGPEGNAGGSLTGE